MYSHTVIGENCHISSDTVIGIATKAKVIISTRVTFIAVKMVPFNAETHSFRQNSFYGMAGLEYNTLKVMYQVRFLI